MWNKNRVKSYDYLKFQAKMQKLGNKKPKYIYCYDQQEPWSLVQLRQPKKVRSFYSLQRKNEGSKLETNILGLIKGQNELRMLEQKNQPKINQSQINFQGQLRIKNQTTLTEDRIFNSFLILNYDQDREQAKKFKRSLYLILNQKYNLEVRRNIYDKFQKAVSSQKKNWKNGKIYQELYRFQSQQQETMTIVKLYILQSQFARIINSFLQQENSADQLFWIQPFVKSMYDGIKNSYSNHKEIKKVYRRSRFSKNQFEKLRKKYINLKEGECLLIESTGFWQSFINQEEAKKQTGNFMFIIDTSYQQYDQNYNSNGYIKQDKKIIFNLFSVFSVQRIYDSDAQNQSIGISFCLQLKYINSNKSNVNLKQQRFAQQKKFVDQHKQLFKYSDNCIQGLAYCQEQSEAGRQYFKKLKTIVKQYFKKYQIQSENRQAYLNLLKGYQQSIKVNKIVSKERSQLQIKQIIQTRDFILNPLQYGGKELITFFLKAVLPYIKQLKLSFIKSLTTQLKDNYKKALKIRSSPINKQQQQWEHEIVCCLSALEFIFGKKTYFETLKQIIRQVLKINFKQLYTNEELLHIIKRNHKQKIIYKAVNNQNFVAVDYEKKLYEIQQFKLIKQIVGQLIDRQEIRTDTNIDNQQQKQLLILSKCKQLLTNIPKLLMNISYKIKSMGDNQLQKLYQELKTLIKDLPSKTNLWNLITETPTILAVLSSYKDIERRLNCQWFRLYSTFVLWEQFKDNKPVTNANANENKIRGIDLKIKKQKAYQQKKEEKK